MQTAATVTGMMNGAAVKGLQILVRQGTSIPVIVKHAVEKAEPQTPFAGYLKVFAAVPELVLSSTQTSESPIRLVEEGTPPTPSFDLVPPGEYRLNIQEYGAECLASAEYGGTPLEGNRLSVMSDEDHQPLTLNMRSDCAFLSATVHPKGAQAAGFLVVVPTSSIFTEPKVFKIGREAAIPIPLTPGTYQLFAFSTVARLEYSDSDVLSAYPGQHVALKPRQKLNLSLDLINR